MNEPFPALSLTTPGPPERAPLESPSEWQRRVAKWRTDNAKEAGQRRALEHLDPLPQVQQPRAPWLSASEANQF